ncbi:hypothetical protein C5167_049551 [Papaver somniferum]|uniref:Uncharacterized protein n=1 Tax=Papaver somniferum TaxID=3469 RepID=A0A4Y7KNW1_PAPSO|nr:hypothetical protein C5167_049551 [Papaver somniferum]
MKATFFFVLHGNNIVTVAGGDCDGDAGGDDRDVGINDEYGLLEKTHAVHVKHGLHISGGEQKQML